MCRYMLAEDEDTLYIAFMGTKQRRDLVANAAVLQVLFWPELENSSVRLFDYHGYSLKTARSFYQTLVINRHNALLQILNAGSLNFRQQVSQQASKQTARALLGVY